jgi:hypothetical protein
VCRSTEENCVVLSQAQCVFRSEIQAACFELLNPSSVLAQGKQQELTKDMSIDVGPVAQSVWRLATGWTVRGSNSFGARFSTPVQTGPGAHPASCTVGTGSFPGVASGWGVTLIPYPLLVPRSENRVKLYLYSP